MGFLIHGFPLFSLVFTSVRIEKGTVKLYFSVPVVLYNCISQNLAKIWSKSAQNLAKIWSKSGQNLAKSGQNLVKSGPKSGHADHVLKT